MSIIEIFFITVAAVSGFGVFYAFAGYPVIMYAVSRIRRRSIEKSLWTGSVSVVLVVHNEESAVRDRIENLLAQSGGWISYELIVASDGSTDGTVEQMRSIKDDRLVVIESAEHRGKAAMLNQALLQCKGEVVVLTDCRQRFENRTVSELCSNFNDRTVGAVSGELFLENTGGSRGIGDGLSAYWNIEKMLRKSESQLDSVIGCTGAVCAVRRECFVPLHPETVLDDVAIPMNIAMSGRRVVFDPEAKAWDRVEKKAGREFGRKIRTLAGSIQLCTLYPALMNPFRNRLFFQFFSHKIMRLFAPWLMLVFLAATVIIATAYRAVFLLVVIQLAFYALAAAGLLMKRAGSVILSGPAAFLLLNICAAAAPIHYWRGKLTPRWGGGKGERMSATGGSAFGGKTEGKPET